ncbi:hypothetical protein [Amycolatopsis sp. DG1A-15b]|uniref:hypothetical protein n=1 Tax=Amycolatopsis sp. DG1A-15b TaxID=3052846 RepID=UPI00255C1CA7|nr:hypothetical protein [Amycolatopsis sp. DG1A-15b]WIX93262.1 hypothetical protein QRY02_23565 [Amycolatopsis sp. DG1A-15b]
MGYSVNLIKGEVVIPATRTDLALSAIHALNQHDDLKSGWTRIEHPDGTFGRRPHWAFTDAAEIAAAQTLPEMLRAFRYEAMTEPDGEVYGVELIGGTRTAGDDVHLWGALAPYVEAGGELIWLGEDDKLQRWSFDGSTMTVADGRMVFFR